MAGCPLAAPRRLPLRTPHIVLVAAACLLLAAPAAYAALAGSGQVTDIVQLTTSTGTLSALSSTASGGSASGSPVTSGASAFTMTNSGSNVDTLIRYAWGTTPYYGASAASTSITIRSATHQVGDLLWFQQQTLNAAAVATTSDYFSPLIVKNAASVATATFASAGNACTGWTGAPGAGFTAVAAGTFTFKYYAASSQSNDAPLTSDTFHYCLDTGSSQVYLGKSASFTAATRVYGYATESTGGVLKTYRYPALSGAQTAGNSYCLVSITGTGTSATPDLAQCQALPFELAGSTTAKLYVLIDPPAYFPSANQGGAITYGITGTQWNPYAAATTNSA